MRMRHKRRWLRLRIMVLPACALALAIPAGAPAAAQQDLRSPDTRDAARAAAQAPADVTTPAPQRVVESTDSGDQALAIVLASAALGIALAGLVVALGALLRRPRARWTVG